MQDLSYFRSGEIPKLFGREVAVIAIYRGAGHQSYNPYKLVDAGYRVYHVDIYVTGAVSYNLNNGGTWKKSHAIYEPKNKPAEEIILLTMPGTHSNRKKGNLEHHTKFMFFKFLS
jgi:hypothetical protein